MKLSKNALINFGKIQTLSKISLIAINEKLNIEHINDYARRVLGLKQSASLIGTSIIALFEQLNLSQFFNNDGEIIDIGLILINNYFQKWQKTSVKVENEKWSLLLGHTIASREELFQNLNIFEKEHKNIIDKDRVDLNEVIINLPELVYWKDKNCIYQGCNKHVAELLNLANPTEIIGKTDYDFGWSPKRIKSLQEVDLAIIQRGINSIVEDVIPVNRVKKIFLTSKTPLHDSHGKIVGILGISTDITDRKKMEKELRRSKIVAEAANHAKSEFIANMSHDIRTPLTGVIGMAKMIEDMVAEENIKQLAQLLEESGNQLLIMLNEILDVASSEHVNDILVQKEVFDLRKTIKNVIELETPSAVLKGLSFINEVDEKIPSYLVGDSTKIHRIILNLVGNAIKFTKIGSVTLRLKCLEKSKEDVLIQACIIDTGIGIPLEFQDKVFEQFTRGTPSHKGFYKGHGLGLHIVQSYVKALGGRVRFTSEVDKGTTFSVELPLKIGEASDEMVRVQQVALPPSTLSISLKASETVKPKAKEIPLDAPHILLVEDNKIALLSLENLITNISCRFTSAMDGESAFDLATTQSFDLIITDVGLPGISGIDLVQKLRDFEKTQQKKAVPVIGLTAHAHEKIKKDCLQAGMNEALTKPMVMVTLERIKTTYLASANSPKPGLGLDLPDTKEELFMLEKFPLFDLESALDGVGNDCNLLKTLLTSLINEETPKDKCAIEKAHAKGDWDSVEKLAHRMKGGFVYCGTPKLIHACQYLERYRKAGHTKSLEPLYQQFFSVLDETMQVINQWLTNDN